MTQDRDVLSLVFVGAGDITFGNTQVTWNHSARIESILGRARLRVLALIDPSVQRVEHVLEQKANSEYAECYADTRRFADLHEAEPFLQGQQVDLVLCAAPPYFRGTTLEGRNLEQHVTRACGGRPVMFTEKPIAMTRPDEPQRLCGWLREHGAVIGVGYMMRYLKVVQKAMAIIREKQLQVMMVTARYNNAYKLTTHGSWFRKSDQGGPMIEQATHFCDLLRYIAGDVDLDTVQVNTVEHDEPAGKIVPLYFDDSGFETEDRIPLCTAATWKHESGTVASLTHAIALHGVHYSDEICIIADGYQMRIHNVYKDPVLYVRSPASDTVEQIFNYPGDDMFRNEMWAVLSAAAKKTGKAPIPVLDEDQGLYSDEFLTSYEDACKTFELTWRLRDASDESAIQNRARRLSKKTQSAQ
ncbi:hypothetical protein TRICI_006540 [Trichomonascus ciferrii]|uniref:Gfo/Idh/MocA-like oxidoreductase N-terminal domain-containing protein n=1 Tax=Trichomonascus ciferrii TaxID=44093 RepID=A0A642UGH1_9ASCO|nr:hypothetical protein TRICI_006540 [Trichomonascus ciferrii]